MFVNRKSIRKLQKRHERRTTRYDDEKKLKDRKVSLIAAVSTIESADLSIPPTPKFYAGYGTTEWSNQYVNMFELRLRVEQNTAPQTIASNQNEYVSKQMCAAESSPDTITSTIESEVDEVSRNIVDESIVSCLPGISRRVADDQQLPNRHIGINESNFKGDTTQFPSEKMMNIGVNNKIPFFGFKRIVNEHYVLTGNNDIYPGQHIAHSVMAYHQSGSKRTESDDVYRINDLPLLIKSDEILVQLCTVLAMIFPISNINFIPIFKCLIPDKYPDLNRLSIFNKSELNIFHFVNRQMFFDPVPDEFSVFNHSLWYHLIRSSFVGHIIYEYHFGQHSIFSGFIVIIFYTPKIPQNLIFISYFCRLSGQTINGTGMTLHRHNKPNYLLTDHVVKSMKIFIDHVTADFIDIGSRALYCLSKRSNLHQQEPYRKFLPETISCLVTDDVNGRSFYGNLFLVAIFDYSVFMENPSILSYDFERIKNISVVDTDYDVSSTRTDHRSDAVLCLARHGIKSGFISSELPLQHGLVDLLIRKIASQPLLFSSKLFALHGITINNHMIISNYYFSINFGRRIYLTNFHIFTFIEYSTNNRDENIC
ncbi:hypothetical protein DERF_009021 [Dermatophagoides farinae]|uniref:Uncharacterized protein n=1 Tax=Dermatophagoides farinae TaxID=6954 RepID=A0A922HT60_DERFA|nr:hypothetical protein DERF_009021 [Dermatophagoides farinae]